MRRTGLEEGRDISDLAACFRERAEGGVGLMVTGGFAPSIAGWTKPFALNARGMERQIRAFVNGVDKAREAGNDGVETMGSEGGFINQSPACSCNWATACWPPRRRRSPPRRAWGLSCGSHLVLAGGRAMCGSDQSSARRRRSMRSPQRRKSCMNPYIVIASHPPSAIVILEDGAGKVHLGRAIVETPAPGTSLAGGAPALGVVALTDASAGEAVPVAMVLLDCDRDVAIKLIELTELTAPSSPVPPSAASLRAADPASADG